MLTFSVGANHLGWTMKGSSPVVRDFSNDALADVLSEFMDAAMEAVARGGVVVGSGRERIAALLAECRMPYLLCRWEQLPRRSVDESAGVSCDHKPVLVDAGLRDNGELYYKCSVCGRML